MLPKLPKSNFWKYVKGTAGTLFVIEAVAFAGSYGVYYRMNTDRDFREYMNTNFPVVLNYYYKVGEHLGNSNIRQIDAAIWNASKKETD